MSKRAAKAGKPNAGKPAAGKPAAAKHEAGKPAAGEPAAGKHEAGKPAPAVPDIARRPAIEPEILAVLTAAVQQAWPRPRVVTAEEEATVPAWRFSGRWWSRPASVRRDRPWT